MTPALEKGWTVEEAQEAQELAEREHGNLGPLGPLFRWAALHELDELERLYRNGDRFYVMQAIYLCALHQLVIPTWVSAPYREGYMKVVNCRVGSWDEAFGKPYPKGFHVEQARQRRVALPLVFSRLREIKAMEPATPIDKALFERVGGDVGVSGSLAEKLYYQWERRLLRKRKN